MKKYLLVASFFALVGLASCELDPYVITKEEEYTRSFIRTFGLIDPQQDWNSAVREDVTVKVDKPVNSLKVYAEVDGNYYLVADYIQVSETVTIPVDIPGATTNIMVKADGNLYYGTIGQTIDITGLATRSVPEGAANQTKAGYTVGVQALAPVPYNAQQMGPITAKGVWPSYWSVNDARMKYNTGNAIGLLPENGIDDQSGGWGNNVAGNRNNAGITQDFIIEPETDGTFTVYPMYWNTSTQHTLGIYLLDDDGNPIMENGDVVKFPIYDDKKGGDIQVYLKQNIRLFTNANNNKVYLEGSNNTVNLRVGDPETYIFVEPNVAVTWTSSNPGVASVNVRNELIAHHSGYATITATAGGKSVSFYVSSEAAGEATSVTANLSFGQIAMLEICGATRVNEGNDMWENLPSYMHGTYYSRFNFEADNNGVPTKNVENIQAAASVLEGFISNNLSAFVNTQDSHFYYRNFTSALTFTPANTEIINYSDYTVSVVPVVDNCNDYHFEGSLMITKNSTPSSSSAPAKSRDASGMPDVLVESGGEWVSVGVSGSMAHNEAYSIDNPLLLKSMGVKVSVDSRIKKVGMYINFTNFEYGNAIERTFYSQKALNTHENTINGANGGESYAATFKHPESNRIYFSFEDWINSTTNPYSNDAVQENGWSDKDLNDLIFRITGFKTITNTDGGSEIKETDQTIDWIWAVEDLGSTDDFDFNDVVVKITSVTTNYTNTEGALQKSVHKVTFTPLAAGGTLPIYLHWGGYVLKPGTYYEDTSLMPTEGGPYNALSVLSAASADELSEYHRWFGVTDYRSMLNTSGIGYRNPHSCTVFLSSPFSIAGFGSNTAMDATAQSQGSKLSVSVNGPNEGSTADQIDAVQAKKDTYTVQAPRPGTPAQMFIIFGNNWRWPKERVHINLAYPDFDDWITNRSVKWYSNPNPDTSYTIGL